MDSLVIFISSYRTVEMIYVVLMNVIKTSLIIIQNVLVKQIVNMVVLVNSTNASK